MAFSLFENFPAETLKRFLIKVNCRALNDFSLRFLINFLALDSSLNEPINFKTYDLTTFLTKALKIVSSLFTLLIDCFIFMLSCLT